MEGAIFNSVKFISLLGIEKSEQSAVLVGCLRTLLVRCHVLLSR